jgi:NMD protein affecting ribosome stability and mRNA decay
MIEQEYAPCIECGVKAPLYQGLCSVCRAKLSEDFEHSNSPAGRSVQHSHQQHTPGTLAAVCASEHPLGVDK